MNQLFVSLFEDNSSENQAGDTCYGNCNCNTCYGCNTCNTCNQCYNCYSCHDCDCYTECGSNSYC